MMSECSFFLTIFHEKQLPVCPGEEISGKIGGASHHVSDRIHVIFVARAVFLEKLIQAHSTVAVCVNCLEAERDPIVCEGELYLWEIGLSAEVSGRIYPQPVEYCQ